VYDHKIVTPDDVLVSVLAPAIAQGTPFPVLRALLREHAPPRSSYYLELHRDAIALMQSSQVCQRFLLSQENQLQYQRLADW
jgi:hypothetical protein